MHTESDGRSSESSAFDDSSFDGFGPDIFTREIENVSASDWDVDTDLLWGEPDVPDSPGADAIDTDFLA